MKVFAILVFCPSRTDCSNIIFQIAFWLACSLSLLLVSDKIAYDCGYLVGGGGRKYHCESCLCSARMNLPGWGGWQRAGRRGKTHPPRRLNKYHRGTALKERGQTREEISSPFSTRKHNVPTLAGAKKSSARRTRFLLESVANLRVAAGVMPSAT